MKKILLIFLPLIFVVNVYADNDVSLVVKCNNTVLSKGEETTCDVSGNINKSVGIEGMSLNIDADSDLELEWTTKSPWTGSLNGKRLVLSCTSSKNGNISFGVLKVKVFKNATFDDKRLNFKSIQFTPSADVYYASDVNTTIKVLSDVNTLSDIKIDGESLKDFSPSKQTYNITTTKQNVQIEGILSDSKATILGNGDKTIDYGKSSFNLLVTSEKGTKLTYTINFTREDNRSNDNTLSDLTIEEIDFNFDKLKTEYSFNVSSNITSLRINATLSDAKASFVEGYGSRTVDLAYGKNEILIKVKSEKLTEKVYTINVTREDNRSSIGELTKLIINNKEIPLQDNVYEYSVFLNYKYAKTNIQASSSANSRIEYEDIRLEVGINEFKIKVISEKETVKEYTIKIERLSLEASMVYIENIEILGYDLNFSKAISSYNLKVSRDTKSLNIKVLPEDDEILYSIIGNNNLKNGSVITINARDSAGTYLWTINIIKDDNDKILGFLSIDLLCYIIFSIGLMAFISSIIYILMIKKHLK